MKTIHFKDLGPIDYAKAWDYQKELFQATIARKVANRELPPEQQTPTEDHLLFCEHPHVYTLGKSGKVAHLLLNEEGLRREGVQFFPIDRGGDITYHGPGQIVGYPIFDLDHYFTDVHRFLRTLEEAVIGTLEAYKIKAGRIDGLTGVWLDGDDPAKARSLGTAKTKLPAEFHRASAGLKFDRLPDSDGWAPEVGFVDGFPVGRDPKTNEVWLAHCYGALGAGRGGPPDSSNGSELYVVTGQSPRQLDRNITLVGRVVKGMELLSAIPRGPEPMGFYENAIERTPITAIRLASEVPESERTPLQVLRTDSKTFAAATEARRNRRDGWYVRPAGHIDLCNVPLPVRTPPTR